MKRCHQKTYNFDKSYSAKFVRMIQDESCPGELPCIAINKLDLIGEIETGNDNEDENFVSYHDDDDDVSIIGHISKNENVKID
ncbi:hypothetical protein TVAG_064810 [Trichomonas vaginalis G3]|uniref:Uncharacterized protein n=1 Tax=Trichomonas vaginalis (strain ATCC PRA-98 / G3) TaxID=412133 RepID=A2EHF5_TRIV3|nr:hypothetical protein TVAGG3_0350380 [Trichomonas vaginalis G3]EAY07933.1 hypothetical protein TVAG_064810 [Trichomonas vaginalis G3]KAI5531243.1 hypothetical protein TVAGG3_0350380 [Trichomonas vaginalis G3]|eukprot:XP_001320156.1 hypothetical protein [Trichomonas vaginalis G3]